MDLDMDELTAQHLKKVRDVAAAMKAGDPELAKEILLTLPHELLGAARCVLEKMMKEPT